MSLHIKPIIHKTKKFAVSGTDAAGRKVLYKTKRIEVAEAIETVILDEGHGRIDFDARLELVGELLRDDQ